MSSGETRPVLVLVGPPGAGKTTVGEMLAHRLGVAFTDVDSVCEQRAGKTIAEVFVEDGEDAFRALEREVVADLLTGTDGVLALGGGSVLAAETRARLRGHRVAHLTVGLADGLRRTGMSTARPLLAGVNPRATFKALLDARAPLYREVATVEIDTVGASAREVTRAVLTAFGLEPVVPEQPEDSPETGGAGSGTGPASSFDEPAEPAVPAPVALPDPTLRP
ncbi:MAG TPA: shikimate kinase [Pseudonocardia sp.]|nr:shikimate kinase [Pseudonocardia sp.]